MLAKFVGDGIPFFDLFAGAGKSFYFDKTEASAGDSRQRARTLSALTLLLQEQAVLQRVSHRVQVPLLQDFLVCEAVQFRAVPAGVADVTFKLPFTAHNDFGYNVNELELVEKHYATCQDRHKLKLLAFVIFLGVSFAAAHYGLPFHLPH
jgi:hypothetical protein